MEDNGERTTFDLLTQQGRPQPPKLVCKKFPRNKPCFCGSGIKFKKCCMKKYGTDKDA